MSDINWDLAPDCEVAIKQDIGHWKNLTWINGEGKWWDDTDASWNFDYSKKWVQTIATRPTKQPKTVADAVKWANGNWGNSTSRYITYNPNSDRFTYSETGEVNKRWYIVCTRDEFEAYVKEQESEKWTHTYSDYGVIKDCILIHDKPDIHGQVLVVNRYDEYVLTGTVEPKPIKPTISEAELLHKIKDMAKGVASDGHFGDTVRGWLDDYDIT